MFAAPQRRWYQRELAREAALPVAAIQRELRRLVGAGLLVESADAGRRLYAPDTRSPIFNELLAITIKLRGPAPLIRETLAAERAVRLAWVFGSFATGTASASSDIDLMVLGGARPNAVRRRVTPVERKLDRTIDEHVMSPAEWRRRLAVDDAFV